MAKLCKPLSNKMNKFYASVGPIKIVQFNPDQKLKKRRKTFYDRGRSFIPSNRGVNPSTIAQTAILLPDSQTK